MGINGLAFVPSYASRICLIRVRSRVKLSIPTRSTTSNQLPLPTSCNALIKNTSAPCVTAVLKLAIPAVGLRCPVLSRKL